MARIESAVSRDIRSDAEKAAATFPALLVEAERVAASVSAGLHGRRRVGPGDQFFQHRPYAFGDSVAAIDWRQSARAADRLFVRQNEWEAAASVWIWRDASASLDFASSVGLPTKRRRADILATALAILLAEGGERVGLVGARARPFHGRGAPARFLEALEPGAPATGSNAPPDFPIAAHAKAVFISDFFGAGDAVAAAAARCAGLGAAGIFLQIVDPAEEEFPYDGRTEFIDVEGPARLMFGDARRAARDYRAAFAAHRRDLREKGRRLGWPLLVHRTDAAPEQALFGLVEALGEKRRGKV